MFDKILNFIEGPFRKDCTEEDIVLWCTIAIIIGMLSLVLMCSPKTFIVLLFTVGLPLVIGYLIGFIVHKIRNRSTSTVASRDCKSCGYYNEKHCKLDANGIK